MKIKIVCLTLLLQVSLVALASEKPMRKVIVESMKIVEKQSLAMADRMKSKSDSLPRTFRDRSDFIASNAHWWASGFYPGVLWYLYEYTGKPEIQQLAESFTARVESQKYTKDNHDVGFILNCSFGNGFRLTHNPKYGEVLATGAKSLATRFRPVCGCIQSWDVSPRKAAKGWQIPVIIDNMMNLELLLNVSLQTSDRSYYNLALSHANSTLNNHFRADNSCYHVVSYDSLTGKADKKFTVQGYSDESAWARGQAWALYGFSMMYAQTGIKRYLEQAKKVADYIIHHPNLPKNKIPYWDFNARYIPKDYRDASAGAIMASALLQLQGFVDEPLRSQYRQIAETQIRTLSSKEYLAKPGQNGNFLLKHSVGSYPAGEDVDAPEAYADYYYVEALLRMSHLLETEGK